MSIIRMIWREIVCSKINFLLCLLTTALATGVFVALMAAGNAANRATAAILRDMGFNIIIVPHGTDMDRYWTWDFPAAEMPEDYVRKLAASDVSAEHFVAKLQQATVFNGKPILLTGVLPSLGRIGRAAKLKQPMGYNVSPGEVFVGSAVATGAKIQKNAIITIASAQFKVARVLAETGTPDDIRVYANLHDVQSLLNKPGRINAIDALGCRCFTTDDFLTQICNEIQTLLPDTQVKHVKSIAIAREMTRRRLDKWFKYILVAVLALAASAIAGLTYLNVRHRRCEIGLLRTIGVSTPKIAWLFLGKVLFYSMPGAIFGFFVGTVIAQTIGPRLMDTPVTWEPTLLPLCAALAPLVALTFGALPIVQGLRLDPAIVLREE
ncbi:MAG: ABC transporter permease [Planctomycetota bacterium]